MENTIPVLKEKFLLKKYYRNNSERTSACTKIIMGYAEPEWIERTGKRKQTTGN